MKKFVYGLLAAALASAPLTAQSNSGAVVAGPASPNVLSAPDGVGGTLDILYAPSQADDATFRAAVAAITGGAVDYFDAAAATPDPTLLAQYDCVYVWVDVGLSDNVLYGDRLANYVDAGGRVVLGAFATYTTGNYLSGQIMTSAYSPVTSPSGTNHFANSAYAGDGVTGIHAGVTAYDSTYRDFLALQGAGLQDGSYLDGEIAVAFRPDFGVIYANGIGTTPPGGGAGDWPLLIANACRALPYQAPLIQAVPTLSGWGLAALLVGLGGAAILFLRRRAAHA